MEEIRREKLGLALSGGGFRASLFHIGILARLADAGILKNVEVLSCVSGGSIIGAYYYLHLKILLESKSDDEITDSDYINIIKEIEKEFTSSVQKNIRVMVFSSLLKNWKMMKENYSSSDRIAELFDSFFYDKFKSKVKKSTEDHRKPIHMCDLLVTPFGWDSSKAFKLSDDNVPRKNKIPALILNATTLNTGRNWQFSAVDIGEHDVNDFEFNKNIKFKAFGYGDTRFDHPDRLKYKTFPLSVAVAASACVPGIFIPLALTKLYPDTTPQLVDGGVYDNQGISAVVHEDCTRLVISDAAGQMDFEPELNGSISGVIGRTFSTLLDRTRSQGFETAKILKKAGEFEMVSLYHLKIGLDNLYLEPGSDNFIIDQKLPKVEYGVSMPKQKMLAAMRTDLDAFSDIEAYSLMKSAYNMAERDSNLESMREGKSECGVSDYKFHKAGSFLKEETGKEKYDKVLKYSGKKFLRAYRLMPIFILPGIIGVMLSLTPFLLLINIPQETSIRILLTFSILSVITLVVQLAGFKRAGSSKVIKIVNHIVTFVIGFPLSIIFKLYNKFINPAYLKYGKVK